MPAWYVYITETGRLSNDWPMGTGLLILPFAWAGTVWAHAWLLALLALVLLFWWRNVNAAAGIKSFALAGLIAGTPVLFYGLFAPFFSHIPSFVLVTAFLVIWHIPSTDRTLWHWALLGLLLGFATLVRPQNALLALAFLADAPKLISVARSDWRKVAVYCLLPMCAGVLIGLAPRFPAYTVLYGSPIALPKIEEMQWLNPNLAKTLFNDYHGVLPWGPVYALGLIGLLLGLVHHRRLSAGLLLIFLVQVYVNAANEVWWSGGSFGNRRLTDYSIIVAWGLVLLMTERGKIVRFVTGGSIILCCAWTMTLLLAERRLIVPLDRYVPFGSESFLPAVMQVYLEPAATWSSLTRSFSANAASRIAAGVVLFVAVGNLPVIVCSSNIFTSTRVGTYLLIVVQVFFTTVVTTAAVRTPPVADAALQARLGRSSAILWDNYIELAGYHMMREEYPAAIAVAEKAIAMRPEAPTAYWYKGMAMLQSGNAAQAADLFETVLRLDPNHHNAGELIEAARRAAASTAPVRKENPAGQPAADWRVQ